VARRLLEHRAIPGLKWAKVIRGEVQEGSSRFDFLVEEGGKRLFLEVKSCTLFGLDGAMFPDAITERGRRHLTELADLSRKGKKHVVLFLVHSGRPRWFMPDFHTDLEFAKTLLAVRGKVRIIPAALNWGADLSLDGNVKVLKIPWGYLKKEARDRGSYLLLMRLASARKVAVGSLGSVSFPAGHYLYVGSAMNGLGARVTRHLRRKKKPHWHVDHLRAVAEHVEALPIRSSVRRECDLAAALAGVFSKGPGGFGSSDCRCDTHLFHSSSDPLNDPAFHGIVQGFRFAYGG
jgi:sugar fermentation stimulation protein A